MRFNVSREDIRVLLLDEAQYKNFQAGRTYYAVYNSGYVQNGNFNLRLTPNFYYIVFSNTEARSLNKSINAFLRVTYETGGID
jgi:DNA-binding transcriptional regulator of glucitol operon